MLYDEITVLNFLTELYSLGKGYSALNTARSALSAVLSNESGLTVGNSVIVKRFLKGVFELRPPLPRYKYIWDVSIVLNFLGNYYPNEDLSLRVLSHKCATLLALSSMQRIQTLASINIKDIQLFDCSIFVTIKKMLKHFRIGKNSLAMNIRYFPDNPAVCPCRALLHYIERTKSLPERSRELCISYNKPHLPVTSVTLGRWIKTVLYEAGIDTKYFKAHSTRAAAASAAYDSDYDVNYILNTAGWANANTFKLFYNKIVL